MHAYTDPSTDCSLDVGQVERVGSSVSYPPVPSVSSVPTRYTATGLVYDPCHTYYVYHTTGMIETMLHGDEMDFALPIRTIKCEHADRLNSA